MSPQRDHELGAALRALPVPEYEPGFKSDLRERFDAEAPRPVARRRPGRARAWRPSGPRALAIGFALAAVLLVILLTQDTSRLGRNGLGVAPATAAELGERVEQAVARARTLAGTLVMREGASAGDPAVTTRTRFELTAAGDQRLQTDGGGLTGYSVVTATETSLNDPRVGGRDLVRTRMASGPPDGGPDDILGRSLAGVVQALRAAGDERIRSTTYDGRPAWRLSTRALVGKNAGPGDSGDRLDITVDRATGFPLRVRETLRGRFVREQRLERLRVDGPAPPARFVLDAPRGPDTQRLDEGYQRVALSRARAVAGYRPLVPRGLPAGYRRAETNVARSSSSSGNEGANPLSRGVVTTAYRRGLDLVLVTTRLRGSGVAACSPAGTGSGPCWADPLGAGEGFFVAEAPLAIETGALTGARARLIVDPRAVPHVWALTRDLVVTVSGDLDADELRRVARSLAPQR